MYPRSRGAIASELCKSIVPLKAEGAGKTGRRRRPWPACSKKSRRQLPQVQPDHPAFPARWS